MVSDKGRFHRAWFDDEGKRMVTMRVYDDGVKLQDFVLGEDEGWVIEGSSFITREALLEWFGDAAVATLEGREER